MNKNRRDRISKIISAIEDLTTEIDELESEEQDAFDAMPEGLQVSERGEKAEAVIEALAQARNDLETATSNLNDAIE